MSYPFPGMNPWLENSNLWRNVHTSLIHELRNVLAPQLEPRYFVDVESHTYISTSPTLPIQGRYPDLSVVHMGEPTHLHPAAQMATMVMIAPLEIDLPIPETIEEPFLEVQLLPERELVTVIELLSHTNKRSGKDRNSYMEKRETYLDSDINFVEIDLLRSWPPMPFSERARADYRIFIHRLQRRWKAQLYEFSVRQPIPIFPLPLLPGDQEPQVDLGTLLHELYVRARYKLVIDYSKQPVPALDKESVVWANELLQEAGQR